MKKGLMVLLWMMVGLSAFAAGPDTLSVDSVGTKNELGLIRRTVREFDRLNDEYIEPQHYEFTVMGLDIIIIQAVELAYSSTYQA